MTAAGTKVAPRLPASLRVYVRDWLSSNNILLRDGDEYTVVDTGYLTHAETTVALIREGIGGGRLARILNTHAHSDHIGGNAALQAAFGCSVAVPEGHYQPLSDWDVDVLLLEPLGQQAQPFQIDATLAAGDHVIAGEIDWELIAVPGHDMDALAFYSPDTHILIPGDALWENGFGLVFPELLGTDAGFAATRATLDRLAQLSVECVIPGHGQPFVDVDAALTRAYGRLRAFEQSPERFARHALKVVLSFALMDKRRIARADLPGFLADSSFSQRLNRLYLRQDIGLLAQTLTEELLAAGVLRAEGDDLHATA